MFTQIFTIARNAFFESIRQPIVLILVLAATLLLILSSPLSAFTMENDQRMLLDIGLATVFMIGMLLAVFVSSTVLGQEIRNKTTLTVVSKPVGRPQFVIGKYLGAALAISLATFYVALVFLLVEQQEVFQTVRVPIHLPVLVFGFLCYLISTVVATWCNYFYGFVFSSTWICVATPLLLITYILVLNFKPDFSSQPIWTTFKPDIWKAIISIVISVLILGSIATALSTRLSQIGTLIATLLIFFLGMMSDAWFSKPIHNLEQIWLDRAALAGSSETVEEIRIMQKTNGDIEEVVTEHLQIVEGASLTSFSNGWEYPAWLAYNAGSSVVPNFQVLWLVDALTQENVIPNRYLVRTSLYGGIYIIAFTAIGIVMFQRKEVM
jgi:ABC-type transport system involved in multi-copper enzyme maturation permease subunit